MTPDGFTFYGGVSHGVEKRSKVRSRLVADQLVKLIKEADHVVIMGHRMSDLDAIGAAEGVLRICKICDVPAVIAVRRDATLAASLIDALCKAGQKDDFIDPKDALPIISKRTLCIVVDTYQVGLVESKDILEKCGKVAVIDHHRKGVGYIEKPGAGLPRTLFFLGQRAGHRAFAVCGRAGRQAQPHRGRRSACRYFAGYTGLYPAHRCAYL